MDETTFEGKKWIAYYYFDEWTNYGYATVEDRDGGLIHLVGVYKECKDEQFHNARLIASAPDMYNILKILVNLSDDYQSGIMGEAMGIIKRIDEGQ